MLTFLHSISRFTAFEGDDDAAAKKAAEEAAAKKAADDGKFTEKQQEQVNKIVAEERRKMQEKQTTTLKEISQLKDRASLTKKEKETLEKKIGDLQNQYLTTEEKARHAAEEAETKRAGEIAALTNDRDGWQKKHSTLVVETAIVDAAAENKAIEHEQILAIISPKTRLVEKLDDEGKPTGEYGPMVSFPDKNKEGDPIVLELSVHEAVKHMTKLEKYGNLFEGSKRGGLGGVGNQRQGGTVDLKKIAKEDPAAYRKLRAERMADK